MIIWLATNVVHRIIEARGRVHASSTWGLSFARVYDAERRLLPDLQVVTLGGEHVAWANRIQRYIEAGVLLDPNICWAEQHLDIPTMLGDAERAWGPGMHGRLCWRPKIMDRDGDWEAHPDKSDHRALPVRFPDRQAPPSDWRDLEFQGGYLRTPL